MVSPVHTGTENNRFETFGPSSRIREFRVISHKVDELVQKQRLLRDSIERALGNFKKIGKSNLTAAKVHSRIQILSNTWQQFQDGHVALCCLASGELQDRLPYFKEGHLYLVEDTFNSTLDFMKDALEALEPLASPGPAIEVSTHRHPPSTTPAPLLPIRLAPFDGNYSEWETFRDRFTALVRENRDISDFTRMHYLATSVSGRALDCIKHLPVTADSFSIAWQALVTRFENPRRLLSTHLSTLLNLPFVMREDAEELHALFDSASTTVSSLKKYGRTPENLWEDILVHIVSQRFDPVTRKAWSLQTTDKTVFPSFSDLEEFLSSRAHALEDYAPKALQTTVKPAGRSRVTIATASSSPAISCPLCKEHHFINYCPRFVQLSPQNRRDLVRKHKRCFNCLSHRHSAQECTSKHSCRLCQQRHHTMLHETSRSLDASRPATAAPFSSSTITAPNVSALHSKISTRVPFSVLLATATVTVSVPGGRTASVRALLDQGSEMTFISENLAQSLHAKRFRVPVSVTAVGGVSIDSPRHATNIFVSPVRSGAPSLTTCALILGSLTAYAPQAIPCLESYEYLSDLDLADSDPTGRASIDIIIGADLYSDVILDGVRKGDIGQPIAQRSIFGWIISGSRSKARQRPPHFQPDDLPLAPPSRVSAYHCLTSPSLEGELRRFWEIEELPRSRILEPSDAQCENHFRSTHSRDPSGRYVVRLPFKSSHPISIGQSRDIAAKLARQIARRLESNPGLGKKYSTFMNEYEQLGHMRLAPPLPQNTISPLVYLPHHPVMRADSATSQLRVVFNASSRTSNGLSLNDYLLAGPKLQSDLAAVVLRWRCWEYVYTADIAKMYRQIRIDESDVDYQRILWHPAPSSALLDYQLLTVTYGMACAPFLALRVLQQLVLDEGHAFPLARPVLQSHIYVDDVLFGSDDLGILKTTRDQLIALLKRGGFILRKWSSNSSSLLDDLEHVDHGLACSKVIAEDDQLKVLGLSWKPSLDEFNFNIVLPSCEKATKRAILSVISRFFDPLGWVSPVIIKAKILMQSLWRNKLQWDELITGALLLEWRAISSRLSVLNSVSIPRWIQCGPRTSSVSLHGFADASNHAYAAVVYLRACSPSGSIAVTLLAAKSKVAPLKPISVPRLELCAAVLLSRLTSFVTESMDLGPFHLYCWTDSTVVLHWVSQHPSRWKPFVGHRVAKIQSLMPSAAWRHVPSGDNPADCASRGLLADELLQHPLWWSGPAWLKHADREWPDDPSTLCIETPLEERGTVVHCLSKSEHWDLADRFSSWPKLIRVTAYVKRFIAHCRHQQISSSPSNISLSADEFQASKNFWLRRIQTDAFPSEYRALSRKESLPVKNPIAALRPFLDPDHLIRVGGRLSNAPISYAARHPILLAHHPLVFLLAAHAHLRALHSGPQLTLSLLRQDYWILRGRSIVRNVIQKCVRCVRERAAIPSQLMGEFPKFRVTPTFRSFLHCGVDYAGPVRIRPLSGRGISTRKAYIALFICLASRAIHLELVSDYSTEAFMGAFARFCSRRGLPEAMYSDNGTTFIGADREMTRAYRAALRDPNFQNSTASDKIAWHFIPPSAPHFGGLWEAGVRSVKFHLSRVMGDRSFTFEEFYTLLCKIEACLSSRPLSPLSGSFDDYDYLTPGHFTIGSAITTQPEPSLLNLNENRLTRWQLVRQTFERFWRLWQHDYINTLQQRSKWREPNPSVCPGRVVLLRNPNLPPGKWELGRVTQCHPGADGLTRVVTLKTANAEYKRPIVKLCLLPVWDTDDKTPSR